MMDKLSRSNILSWPRNKSRYDTELSPEEKRLAALNGSPEIRAKYTFDVGIACEGYKLAISYIENMINRADRNLHPGGMWLLGEGGTGKTFIINKLIEMHPPIDTIEYRCCPLLSLVFKETPSISSILATLALQLGISPRILAYKGNTELQNIVVEAIKECHVSCIIYDESHHLWLSTQKRNSDRRGGKLGDFLKLFYESTKVSYIFSGTPGLKSIYDADKQISTRWPGICMLTPFKNDENFRGVLQALDAALPFPELSSLANDPLANRLFESSSGSFRLLKTLLSNAVRIAAEANCPHILPTHLAQAHFFTFCEQKTPFGFYAA